MPAYPLENRSYGQFWTGIPFGFLVALEFPLTFPPGSRKLPMTTQRTLNYTQQL